MLRFLDWNLSSRSVVLGNNGIPEFHFFYFNWVDCRLSTKEKNELLSSLQITEKRHNRFCVLIWTKISLFLENGEMLMLKIIAKSTDLLRMIEHNKKKLRNQILIFFTKLLENDRNVLIVHHPEEKFSTKLTSIKHIVFVKL